MKSQCRHREKLVGASSKLLSQLGAHLGYIRPPNNKAALRWIARRRRR